MYKDTLEDLYNQTLYIAELIYEFISKDLKEFKEVNNND